MTRAESFHMVLKGAFVFKIGTANANPPFPTILLMGSPIALDSQELTADATRVRFLAVFAFVVRLERSKVFERLGPRMVNVVPAPFDAAVTRDP